MVGEGVTTSYQSLHVSLGLVLGPLSVYVLCFGIVRVCPYVVVLAGSVDTA